MKRLDYKKIIYSFFLFFGILLLFAMSLKNRNGSLSGYDLVICCTTYSGITIYLLVPFLFIKRVKNEMNSNILIRYKSIDEIWLNGCKSSIFWAIEMTISIMVSLWLNSLIIADSVCDWTNKNSIFFRYTQYNMDKIPTVKDIFIPAFIIILFNILFIELLTFVCYWYTNMYWFGYVFVIITYLLPELPEMKFQVYGLGLFYTDYCISQSIIEICLKRVIVFICLIVIMIFLGLIRRKRDFLI